MIICLSLLSTEVVFTPKVVKAAQGCVPVFLDVRFAMELMVSKPCHLGPLGIFVSTIK